MTNAISGGRGILAVVLLGSLFFGEGRLAQADGCGSCERNRGCSRGSCGSCGGDCGCRRGYAYANGTSCRRWSRWSGYRGPYVNWGGVRLDDGSVWLPYTPCALSGYGYGPGSCGARCAPRCGYRFYSIPYSSVWYGRRDLAIPVSQSVAAEAEELIADESASVPAVPPGPRAAAHEALFRGDFAAAVSGFRGLATEDPADANAWLGVAHAAFALRQFETATDALGRAARLGAVSPTERMDVAAIHQDPSEFRARISGLKARVRYNVLDTDARLVLAWVEAGVGEAEDSTSEAKYVLEERPNDPVALALLGRPVPTDVGAAPTSSPSAQRDGK